MILLYNKNHSEWCFQRGMNEKWKTQQIMWNTNGDWAIAGTACSWFRHDFVMDDECSLCPDSLLEYIALPSCWEYHCWSLTAASLMGGLCLALGNRTIQNRPLCVGERQQHADLGLHGSTHLPYFGTALKGCPGTRAAPLMSFVSVTTTLRVHLPLHSPVLLYFLGGWGKRGRESSLINIQQAALGVCPENPTWYFDVTIQWREGTEWNYTALKPLCMMPKWWIDVIIIS